ncbi:glycoside hydrolase family 95-like protein [Brachybacterium sp. ACRRE]|uniref:glycosyl hydrolase family 95 catalytic domain-containing protein n=1 Tax=Brachybacterium sp. ACRRE TaxID=2918184 RepID=UPI001EF3BC96|nr:hypothetical protein [Brachybacterium sp. ACRRE]MCG7310299.1 hypothetical protein [Brachybacterium sp. ACRRE]
MGLPGENLPDERLETGDLLWGLHNVWLTYRFTMDAAVLRDTLFPVLRRAVNLYLHVLEEDAEGELHIPTTYSPEYGTTRDANYDLSLLSWGCRTLLTVCDLLGEDDPKIPEWHRVVNRLTPAPQDDTGLRIGADLALQTSHRHYSHLLWFYPLHLFDPADPEHEQLLRTSLEHWLGMTGALQGYTLTGAASMYALLGEGDRSLELLDQLMDEYIKPNTMYAESGPVIETPLSAAQSIHDMLLTSWGDRLRIFPAVPTGWKEVSFDELRAEGGFRVSAVRSQGVTKEVRITSDAGEPLRVAPTGLPSPWVATDARSGRALRMHVEAGVADIALERGRTAVLRTRGDHHEPPRPVLPAAHHWGLPADQEDR